jgi:chemotaxis family two-component system response regulator Rcp1
MSSDFECRVILLVEDNPGDVELVREALKEAGSQARLHVAPDGDAAMQFLRRTGSHHDAPRPDLMLLDLKMPLATGHQLLAEVKGDPDLRSIPVVILTSSTAERDILMAYNLNANCYVTKPGELEKFMDLIAHVEAFWLRNRNSDQPGTE